MGTVLITGSSRGLGLELARQYAGDGWMVIATCRDPSRAIDLKALEGAVSIEALEVTDARAIEAVARRLESTAIDVLILNAAVHLQRDCTLEGVDPDLWVDELKVNLVAPVMVASRLADHVARSAEKRIVAITSGAGSIEPSARGGNYAYRTGKAALNHAVWVLALDLASRGITVAAVAPGLTRTDMGGPDAPHSVEDSAARIRSIIAGLRFEDSGSRFDRDGSPLPR